MSAPSRCLSSVGRDYRQRQGLDPLLVPPIRFGELIDWWRRGLATFGLVLLAASWHAQTVPAAEQVTQSKESKSTPSTSEIRPFHVNAPQSDVQETSVPYSPRLAVVRSQRSPTARAPSGWSSTARDLARSQASRCHGTLT